MAEMVNPDAHRSIQDVNKKSPHCLNIVPTLIEDIVETGDKIDVSCIHYNCKHSIKNLKKSVYLELMYTNQFVIGEKIMFFSNSTPELILCIRN